VLKLLVKGMTNGEIATQLNISPATVKFHVSSLLGKLHATTRTEAATIAVQHHLIDD
jgi:DNA-binding NarL/FixJ family response regulator